MITIKHNYPNALKGLERENCRYYIKGKNFFLISKRIFDIIISLIVIIFLLSWFVPVLGALIKLNSGGSVFFVQRRVGRGLRSFRCIKFRTMFMNCEANKSCSSQNDQRITSIGRFLRRTSLDELPQFFNVLLGDMSIIGPRPHMFSDCNRFSNHIKYYKFRTLIRPGITGLAQVKGFRGPAEDIHQIASRFSYDSLYIQYMSVGLDVKIFLSTLIQAFNSIIFKGKRGRRSFWKIKDDRKKIAA